VQAESGRIGEGARGKNRLTGSSGGARVLEQAGPAAGPKVLW